MRKRSAHCYVKTNLPIFRNPRQPMPMRTMKRTPSLPPDVHFSSPHRHSPGARLQIRSNISVWDARQTIHGYTLTFRRTRGRSRVERIVAGSSSSVGLLRMSITHVAPRKALARSHDAPGKSLRMDAREYNPHTHASRFQKKNGQPLLAITSVYLYFHQSGLLHFPTRIVPVPGCTFFFPFFHFFKIDYLATQCREKSFVH